MRLYRRDSISPESIVFGFLALMMVGFIFGGCAKKGSSKSSDEAAVVTPSTYLYVSSGLCQSGGSIGVFTTSTASNQVFRINVETGVKDATIADYTTVPSQLGDSPVSVARADDDELYVLVENNVANLRRIEKIEKRLNGDRSIVFFGNGTTGFNILRSLAVTPQGDFLMARNTAVEKISSSGTRVTSGTAAFIALPATGGCAMPTTGTLSQAIALPNGMVAVANTSLGTLSKVGIVSSAGYANAASCISSVQSPLLSWSVPTAIAYDSTNNYLLVAYAGFSSLATSKVNTIYAYSVNATSGSLAANPTRIYDQSEAAFPTFLYGISAMALDQTNGHLYVASSRDNSATSIGHFIEKFEYTPANISGTLSSTVLTRVGTTPFFSYSVDTKCISGMVVDN